MKNLQLLLILILSSANLATLQQLDSNATNLLTETRTKFDDDLREIVEFLKLQMVCGYPPWGVPSLKPFEMEFKEFDYHKDHLWLQGNFSSFEINGLTEFDVVELHWNNILAKITFDFTFPFIEFNSLYRLNVYAPLKLYGSGIFRLQFFNLRFKGSFKLKPLTITNGLTVKDFKVQVSLESSRSKTTGIMYNRWSTKLFNAWLEEFITLTFEDEEVVSRIVESYTVPVLNKALKNISMVDLVAMITGLVNDVVPEGPKCDF